MVKLVVALVLPETALITVEPMARGVASPVAEIVAAEVFDEDQVTVLVMSWVVPSAKVAVAWNCSF